MGIVRHSRCAAVDWLTSGPIAPHADAIKQHFVDGRYQPIDALRSCRTTGPDPSRSASAKLPFVAYGGLGLSVSA